jgi:hypothetical protein
MDKKEVAAMIDAKIKSHEIRIGIISGIAGFLFRAPWLQRENRVFCSELVFSRCLSNGVALLKRIPAFKVSPSLLTLSPVLCPRGHIIANKPTP